MTDLAVIGLGGIGSGVAYWAAKRGASVRGFEQFSFGHDRGASHDHSRIIRYSYHTPYYVELSKLAYSAWAVVEAESGEELVVRCGGLDLFPGNCAIPSVDYRASLDACGIEYEWLSAQEIRGRWPQFNIADNVSGLFQADGGLVAAARSVAAHQRLAKQHGAQLSDNARVKSVQEVVGGVEIVVGDGTIHADAVVISADAWTNTLLAQPLPLTVMREQVTYFDSATPEVFSRDSFPVWIWMDEPSFYGFPSYGEAATKVAQDCGGHVTTADDRTFDTDPGELQRVTDFTQNLFGNAVGEVTTTKTCLYTLTPDREFIVDRAPGTDNIWVVQGAAHAYKYASALGALLTECALDGDCTSTFDRSPFRIDRPAITNPPLTPSWMV